MISSTILDEISKKVGKSAPKSEKSVATFVKKVVGAPSNVWDSLSPESSSYLKKQIKVIKSGADVEMPPDLKQVKRHITVDQEWREEKAARKAARKAKETEQEEPKDEDYFQLNIELESPPTHLIYPVSGLIDMYKKSKIVVPDYQRDFCWKRNERRLFIDSIYGRVPIPSLFIAIDPSDKKERQNLIDGQQRLKTLVHYFDNNERVNGKRFEQMPEALQDRFLSTQLHVLVIRTARKNQPEIFRRINIASRTLKDIEMRWSTYFDTDLFKALRRMADTNQVWVGMYGENTRFSGLNALSRALAMHARFAEYSSTMTKFMDKFCEVMPDHYPNVDELLINLDNVVMALNDSMDKNAFKFGEEKPKVNLGMVDAMIHAGLKIVEKYPDISIDKLGIVLHDTKNNLLGDAEMVLALSEDTSTRDAVFNRMMISENYALERARQ